VHLGMNEKACMNTVKLENYFVKVILSLYPDVEDIAKQRVIIKVDSGPEQNNIDMLAYMRGLGLYCYPGFLNTTHVIQKTNQNYGLFKSNFCSNLEILS